MTGAEAVRFIGLMTDHERDGLLSYIAGLVPEEFEYALAHAPAVSIAELERRDEQAISA